MTHEEFTFELRKNMGAVVKWFGKCVRNRMLPTLCLEPSDLWGDFEHVKLWLEWDEDPLSSQSRLERFAVFVMHLGGQAGKTFHRAYTTQKYDQAPDNTKDKTRGQKMLRI